MQDTVPAAEVREFAAALRDALYPPDPADLAGWDLHDRMIVNRAAHIAGVLRNLADGTGAVHLTEVHTTVIREMASQPLPYKSAGDAS